MTKNTNKEADLLSLVNGSGFLLQLRVKEEIEKSRIDFSVIEEHPWELPEINKSGFIDLLLSKARTRIVIECKRSKDAQWVFLTHQEQGRHSIPVNRLLWMQYQDGGKDLWGIDNFIIYPHSLTSSFCIVRGSSDHDKPMLERICHNLLLSIEAVLKQELSLPRYLSNYAIVFMPIIITTAELFICKIPSATISLENGELPLGSYFEPVPFIRFEKSLLTDKTLIYGAEGLDGIRSNSTATVFIVQANNILDFLNLCEIKGLNSSRVPWSQWRIYEEQQKHKEFG